MPAKNKGIAEPDLVRDARADYADQRALVLFLVKQWETAGKPLTTAGGGATGLEEKQHPLYVMLREARKDLEFYAARVRKRGAGGPAAAARPGLEPSPAQQLRQVK